MYIQLHFLVTARHNNIACQLDMKLTWAGAPLLEASEACVPIVMFNQCNFLLCWWCRHITYFTVLCCFLFAFSVSLKLLILILWLYSVLATALPPTFPVLSAVHEEPVVFSLAVCISLACSLFHFSCSVNSLLRSFSRNRAYSESACFSAWSKSFVTGTSVHEPNSWMASFTMLRAKLLLGDSDPLSFVNITLFAENPLSGTALPWDSNRLTVLPVTSLQGELMPGVF